MLDPVLVDVAQMQPGTCFLCRTIVGPFVDTWVTAIEGRVYVCTTTCASQIASLAGFVAAGDLAERDQQLDDALAEVADLEAALAKAEELRVVPLTDVIASLQGTHPTMMRPASNALCSAIRKDGFPCTASALPGRDTCVAHSKVAA